MTDHSIRITFTDREMKSLENFVSANGIDIAEYAKEAVMSRLNVDRYGDMNMMKKPKTTRKRTTKTKTETPPNENADAILPPENVTVQPETDTTPQVTVETEIEEKPKKRVIKIKR